MRRRFLLVLLPLAALVAASCALVPAPESYTGVKARTPVDKIPSGGEMKNFTLVGQNPLLDAKFNLPRGMNGGVTAVRDCLYVGSNIGLQPTLVLDMKDLTKPTVVGELQGIPGRGMGIEAIEAVEDLNLLVNTVRRSFGFPGVTTALKVPAADDKVGLVIYDTTDCRKPTIAAKFAFPNTNLHYMTLWRDPTRPERVLASLTFSTATAERPDGIDIRVVDLTGCPKSCNPKTVAEWGLRAQFGIPTTVETEYAGGKTRRGTATHDSTFSLDGTRLHLAQSHFGYLILDSTPLAKNQACNSASPSGSRATGHCLSVLNPDLVPLQPFGTVAATVHGVVKIPGRPYVSLQHEGHSCPYGGITIAYMGSDEPFSPGGPGSGLVRGDLFPRPVGIFGLPEQNVDRCPKAGEPIPATTGATGTYGADMLRTSKTIHNVLAFPSIMFASWYGGGLRAIDITNPYTPFELGYFFNKPAPEVRWCGEQTAVLPACENAEVDAEGVPVRVKQKLPPDVFARSYPIVMNGHVVYSDENMGVYVLKYTGPHANEIPKSGLCISHNPGVTKPGFEPCPPYK